MKKKRATWVLNARLASLSDKVENPRDSRDRAGGSAGRPWRVARPWFSGNRQRSGAIKRVICVLQFDPAALGAVPRSGSNLREFLGIRVPPCGQTSWVPSHARCHRRPLAPLSRSIRHSSSRTSTVDGHQEDGARTQHCLVDSSSK